MTAVKAPLLMDAPFLFPGRCATCGSSHGRMVDTHIEDTAGSTLYLCANVCVPAFAALIGLGDTAAADERAEKAEQRILELEAELVEAQPVLDAMATAARRFAQPEGREPRQQPRRRKPNHHLPEAA